MIIGLVLVVVAILLILAGLLYWPSSAEIDAWRRNKS